MAKTVVGSFNDYSEAQQVVQDLERAGVPRDEISIVANDARGDLSGTGKPHADG
jgi:hypothetical protein